MTLNGGFLKVGRSQFILLARFAGKTLKSILVHIQLNQIPGFARFVNLSTNFALTIAARVQKVLTACQVPLLNLFLLIRPLFKTPPLCGRIPQRDMGNVIEDASKSYLPYL